MNWQQSIILIAILLWSGQISGLCASEPNECEVKNIALGKQGYLSSDYHDLGPDCTSPFGSRLTDGNVAQAWAACSCMHTNSDAGEAPWIVVDLGQSSNITHVKLFNRDSYGDRLHDFTIAVGDSFDQNSFTPSSYNQICTKVMGSVSSNEIREVRCDTTVIGRYVALFMEGTSDILHICELEVFSCPDTQLEQCRETNIALGKPGYQSSDYHDLGPDCTASFGSRLTDGNIAQAWESCSCTHTDSDADEAPWLVVDLGESYEVTHVRIFNRDSYGDRLHDFTVAVGNTFDDSLSYSSICARVSGSVPSGGIRDVRCDTPVTGRYVTLFMEGTSDILHVCELEVFTCSAVQPEQCDETNIALGKPGYQSSDYHDLGPDCTASFGSRLTDGNIAQAWASCSCTHTDSDADEAPWLVVDLGESHDITHVRIFNRDSYGDRLHDFTIAVGDTFDEESFTPSIYNTVCAKVSGSVASDEIRDIHCDTMVTGRYVALFMEGTSDMLHICELEVFGCREFKVCDPNPCENDGECIEAADAYTCECMAGYTGSNCESEIDECESNPCQNGGTCTDGSNSYTCQCEAGYTGTNCEAEMDECESNPCQNGGTCTDGPNSYTCQCLSGYAGTNCDSEINLESCDQGFVKNCTHLGGEATNVGKDPLGSLRIFPSLAFECAGKISGWEFFSRKRGNVHLDIFRPGNSGQWTLIGRNSFRMKTTGFQSVKPEEDGQIEVQVGDVLGVHYDKGTTAGIVSFTDKGEETCLTDVLTLEMQEDNIQVGTVVTGSDATKGYISLVAKIGLLSE